MTDAAHAVVATGLRFPEGPIACADGSVIVVEVGRGTLTRVAPDGSLSVIAECGGGPNGAAVGPDRAIYVCNCGGFAWHEANGLLFPGHASDAPGLIQRVDPATGEVTTLYDACDGEPLRAPNDLVFDAHGGFWFSDYGKIGAHGRDHGRILYARADGSHIAVARGELLGPNGVGLSPAGGTLYVSETATSRLWAMDIAAPGELAPSPSPWQPGRLVMARPDFAPFDSLAVEADGRVCVATMVTGGITIASADGSFKHVALPDIGITNICFGGVDRRTAWVTASTTGRLLRVDWPRPGLPTAHTL